MAKIFETGKKQETAVLIGVIYQNQKDEQADDYLTELEFLASTAGAKTLKRFKQRLPYPNPRTFLGEGKLTEVADYIKENEVDLAVFDDELTPSQIRNIEKSLNCKILDRSNLILDIFAKRARTSQARTQVELAQSQYLLPRLTKMWTHLSKQKGGIGMKGPGETEIETDRRVIRNKISRLKERLDEIDKQNETRRRNRDDKTRIALVGYTNVGKSTLMNLLSKAEILAENKLFATVDSTVRKVVWEGEAFLITDTVGFIRKLPHQLIECFKSTLDEVREADILLHVVDISHDGFEEQMTVVKETLHDIGAHDKPTLIVFNKIDKVRESHETVDKLKSTWMAREHTPVIFISAEKNENINELKSMLLKMIRKVKK